MTDRTLTITLQPDWKAGLRLAAERAQAERYAGEVLNFDAPLGDLASTVEAINEARGVNVNDGGALDYREPESALVCPACTLRYPIRDDIPIMLLDEASPL